MRTAEELNFNLYEGEDKVYFLFKKRVILDFALLFLFLNKARVQKLISNIFFHK